MNIFNKYGIREVADVIFYSITRIGDEEIYTPVLFFDSLKITNLTKSLEVVNARGGKANTKVLSWNYETDTKLRLEDALFSQASLDMFMNGRVLMKLSNWTSAIAKLKTANKYGQKNYSIKAFPSPKLTKEEEEIIFRCAQRCGYDSSFRAENYNENTLTHQSKYLYDTKDMDEEEDAFVAENRKKLLENYYKRTCSVPYPHDLSPYLDYNYKKYEGFQAILQEDDDEYNEALNFANASLGEQIRIQRLLKIICREKDAEEYQMNEYKNPGGHGEFVAILEKRFDGLHCISAGVEVSGLGLPEDFFPDNAINGPSEDWYRIGDEFLLNHIPFFVFPRYLEVAIKDLCFCDQTEKSQKAIPQKVIDAIAEEIDTFKKIGIMENDLYETEMIDRFEKCVVSKREGQKIDLYEQYINLKKQYNNEKDTYNIFYDEKTMLPFTVDKKYIEKLYSQKCLQFDVNQEITKENMLERIKNYFRRFADEEWVESLTVNDFIIVGVIRGESISPTVYYRITKHDYITLRYGTVYYKWSRTINEDISGTNLIGFELAIDADTFSGEYLIVGETYIRQQKTGKDERYQFIINRAAISSSTKIQMQAEGDPSVFTLDVDVLIPKTDKKSMIELRQYKVDEDKQYGGFKILSQNKKHTQTSTVQSYDDIVIENKEIY